MIKHDKTIIEIDSMSILYYLLKILEVKLNDTIIINILKILKQTSKCPKINNTDNIKEMLKVLKCIENQHTFHNDEILLIFSQIISILCKNTSHYKDIAKEFYIFLFEYIMTKECNSIVHTVILEDLKLISSYVSISTQELGEKISDILIVIFNKNYTNNNKYNNQKNLINVFQIISTLAIHSETLKELLINKNLLSNLKSHLSSNKFDSMLEYQAKGNFLILVRLYYEFNSEKE